MHSFQRVYDAVRLCGHRWFLEILTALQQGQPMRFPVCQAEMRQPLR
ncbi:hypothetical protein C5N14_14935 [Micromonospora sp. MW-13]|nr:hypothetical protein C5N14_14935 [Micromonospora sp. MW-13]